MLLGFSDYEAQSRGLATVLDMPFETIHVHRFPDGELKLELPSKLPPRVVVCRSLDRPNEKLIELLLAAKTARELGAQRLTLVAPYLCYMRQDKAFHPGEAVSQPIVGRFLADLFDDVITVDPHLHRVRQLGDAVPSNNAVALTATALMADFLQQRLDNPLLLGPDREAKQWVSSVAAPAGWDFGVCTKNRLGDRQVQISLPEIDIDGRAIVLVDDVASSGRTLAVAASACLARHAARVDVLVTHALFCADALRQLVDAGVHDVWSTDSVSHQSNRIALAALIGDAVSGLE
ncbi:MAG: ribose-phosphate diphosphokinase [Gammaproteobacteria bacterium]|nr:MAG: ribose-phosphate diphosphokinase [Gammaproteobacteria bacterium]